MESILRTPLNLVISAMVVTIFSTPSLAQITPRQSQLLVNSCVQCHAEPRTGAPLFGDTVDWKKRWSKGENAVLKNVIEGVGGMPPLGYCSACNETDFRVLIRTLAGLPIEKSSLEPSTENDQ